MKWILHPPGFALPPRLLRWKTFKQGVKKTTWPPTWQHFHYSEVSRGQVEVSWATSSPRTRNPTSKHLHLKACSDCFSIVSTKPTSASNNLVLDWNPWPTGALLHRRLNSPVIKFTSLTTAWFKVFVVVIHRNLAGSGMGGQSWVPRDSACVHGNQIPGCRLP